VDDQPAFRTSAGQSSLVSDVPNGPRESKLLVIDCLALVFAGAAT